MVVGSNPIARSIFFVRAYLKGELLLKIFLPILLVAFLLSGTAHAQEETPSHLTYIGICNQHWNLRATGAIEGKANPKEINLAIDAYRKAVEADTQSLFARWHLMRGLYFKGEYTTEDKKERRKIYDEGKEVGEESLRLIRLGAEKISGEAMLKASPIDMVPLLKEKANVVESFFWLSVQWGKWAEAYGKFKAARKGAAGKIRDLATAAALMDPDYEEGGGYRVLGRLHHQTPSIPFITGWASKKEGVEFLRLAQEAGPGKLLNHLYLAEALWDGDRAYRAEAMEIFQALVDKSPRPESKVEDLRVQISAQALVGTGNDRD